MATSIERLLDRLKTHKADVLDLLQAHRTRADEPHWRQDPRLYRAFAKKLISAGHPTRAVELLREALEYHRADLDLKYLLALAFARGGNIVQAKPYLDELLKVPDLEPRLQVEVFSLEGRSLKDRYARTADPAVRTELARKSAACYLRAARVSDDLVPLINAATMSLLGDDAEQARALASKIVRRAKAELKEPGKDQDYWLLATLAEASLILGDLKRVKDWILRAVQVAGDDVGDVASTRRNLLLLKDKIEVGETIWGLFNIGTVVAFSGHMLDHPRRTTRAARAARFPPDAALERRVGEAIRERLANLNATVGYCSAACGSDILFAECMLERKNAELHVILPFHKEDFYHTSVDFGLTEMASWRARCDAVLARAKQVHYATAEHYFETLARLVQSPDLPLRIR